MRMTSYPPVSTDKIDISTSVFTGDTITAGTVVGLCNGKVADISKNGLQLSQVIESFGFDEKRIFLTKLSNTRVAAINFVGSSSNKISIIDYSNDYTSTAVTGTSSTNGESAPFRFIGLDQYTLLSITAGYAFKYTWTGTTYTRTSLNDGGSASFNTCFANNFAVNGPGDYDVLKITNNDFLVLFIYKGTTYYLISCVWVDIATNTVYASDDGKYNTMIPVGNYNTYPTIRFTNGLNYQVKISLSSNDTTYLATNHIINGGIILTSSSTATNKTPKLSPYYAGESLDTAINAEKNKSKMTISPTDGIRISIVNDYNVGNGSTYIKALRNYNTFGIALNTTGSVRIKGKVTNMSGLIPGSLYAINGWKLEPCIRRENALGQALSTTNFIIF